VSAAQKLKKLHATRVPPQECTGGLHAINDYNFALIWPFTHVPNESRSDWVFSHVIPFFIIALIRAKNMIEKAGLPKLA